MRFQLRWHMFRQPIFVIQKSGRDYHINGLLRVYVRYNSQAAVRLDGMIFTLHPSEALKKFYWKKVGKFGRKKVRPDAPKFLLDGVEATEKDLIRPFVKQWEPALGYYC